MYRNVCGLFSSPSVLWAVFNIFLLAFKAIADCFSFAVTALHSMCTPPKKKNYTHTWMYICMYASETNLINPKGKYTQTRENV